MKKRIISIILSIVMLVSLLPTTAFAATTESGKASMAESSTADDYTLYIKWNTDDKVDSATSNTNIKTAYVLLYFSGPGDISVTSTSGWDRYSIYGNGRRLYLYFSPDTLETLNAKAYCVVTVKNLPYEVYISRGDIGSARKFGGTISCYRGSDYSSNQVGSFQIGINNSYATNVERTTEYQQLASAAIAGDGAYTLPTTTTVVEAITATGTTNYGLDAGVERGYHKADESNDADRQRTYRGYITSLSATDASGNSITGVTPVTVDNKATIQISPDIYNDLSDNVGSLDIKVTATMQMIDNKDTPLGNTVSDDTTLTFTRPTQTVSFNTGGGSSVAQQTVYYHAKATEPASDPVWENHIFEGWYEDSSYEKEFDFSTTDIVSDTTVYAKWTEKNAVSIIETAQTYTWDNNPKSFAITGTPNTGFTVQYKINGNWTTTATSAVGTYDVKITRAEDDTYKTYEKEITGGLVINAATPTATAPTAKTGLVYDGNAKSLINAGTSDYGHWEYSLDCTSYSSDIPTGTDAKTYTVYCRFVPNTGYAGIDSVERSVTISPKEVAEPTVVCTYTYTGEEQTATVTGKAAYMTESGAVKGTNAGDYTITYTLNGNHCWANGSDGKVTWSIGKAALTATASSHTVAYGATAPTYTVSYTGWLKGEETPTTAAALTSEYTTTSNVGEYAVTFETTPVFANYSVTTENGKVTVERAKTAVEPTVADGLVYTGNPQNGYTDAGTHVTLGGTSSATNAAESYSFTATPDANYAWSDGSTEAKTYNWSIGKAAQIITANEEQSFVFGDADKTVITSALDNATLSYAVKSGDSVTVDESSGALTINKIGDTVVTVTAAETNNYDSASKEITVKIGAKKIAKPTENTNAFTYTGEEQTYTPVDFNEDTMTISGNKQTNANESGYTVTVTPKENYAWNTDGDCTFTWKIAKADYDMSGVSFENTSNVYDGNEHKPAVSGTLPTGADDIQVTVSYSEGRTDVGETTVTATFATTSTNYNVPSVKTAKQTITEAEITNISVSQTGTLTYTGQPQTATVSASATTVNSQTESFTYCDTQNGTYTASVPAFTAAGEHTVYYKVTALNHGEKSGSFPVTIGKAPVEAPEISSKVYTGKPLSADVATSTLYTVTTNNGGTAVGSYDVVLTLSNTTNYKWSDSEDAAKTLKFNITKADNAWTTTPAIADVTYGTAISPVGEANFGTAAITYVGTGSTSYASSTTAPTDAGTYKATFAVAATNDYGNLSTDVTFTIAQKAVTLTTDDKSKVYGENDPELTSTLTGGLVGTDTLNYTLSRAEGETVGTYTISAVLGENPNYAVTVKNDGKLTISKATPTVRTALTALAIYGSTVDNDDIRGAMNVPGSFAWKDVTSYGNATAEGATTKFDAVFTPTDAVNYETLDVDVAVTVLKASQEAPKKGEGFALGEGKLTAKDGYELSDGTETAASFTIEANKTYSVRLKEIENQKFASPYTAIDTTVTVNVLAVPSGMGTVSGGGKYNIGSSVTLIATPKNGYKFIEWQDLSGTQKSTDAKYTIPSITTGQTLIAAFKPEDKTVVAIPAITNATYNNSQKTGVASGANYTLSGTTSATNAGAYTVTATLKEGSYVWSDGTTAPKTLVWNIFKAPKTAPTGLSVTDNKNITGVDTTMEYMKQGDSSYTAVSGTTISNLGAGTYYLRYKGDDNHNPSPITVVIVSEPTLSVVTLQPSDLKSKSATLNGVFAPYKAGCTAKFLLNGAEKLVESVDENGVFSLTTGLEPDTDYMVTAVVKDTQGNTVTFHTPAAAAAPVVVEDGKIKVNVTAEGSGSSKFIISVERGNDVIASCTSSNASGDSATANFDNLPYGNYNVVVRTNNGHYTETKMLSVAADNKEVTVNFTIPVGKLATVVNVKTKETPKTAVDGLSEILTTDDKNAAAAGSKDVEIKLEVEKKAEDTTDAVQSQIKELLTESASENVKVDFIDMSLIKTTTELDASGNATSIDTQNIGATNNTVIEIAVPYGDTNKAPKVLRYHNGMAEELKKLKDRPTAPYMDGTYFVGNGYVFIYASGFSTYAIGYEEQSGGSSSYAVAVESAENGIFTVDKKNASSGSTVTITVTPDKGFTLETLTVLDKNGKEIEVKNLGENKYSFKMPSGKVTVSATFMEDNTMLNFFVDVKATDYFYDAVLWAAENGITKGTDDVHFSPDMGTTRAQVVTFLWRAAGCPEPTGDASKFVDVPANEYYAKAVAWAIEQGITKGTSDTTFSPDMVCTRGQIVTFLARFAGVEDADTASVFSDVKSTDYFAAAVKWAKDNKVTEGTSATTFSPNTDCTRAQVVTFLYRWMVK